MRKLVAAVAFKQGRNIAYFDTYPTSIFAIVRKETPKALLHFPVISRVVPISARPVNTSLPPTIRAFPFCFWLFASTSPLVN